MYSYIIVQIVILAFITSLITFFTFGIGEVLLGICLGLLLAFYNLNLSYLGAQENFGVISRVAVFRAFAIVTLQYVFSKLNFLFSIVIAVILAEILTQFAFYKVYHEVVINIKKIWRYHKVVLARYKDFYLYGVFTDVIAIIAFTFPLYFIDYKYGENVSGNYGMAYRLIWGPIVLLTSAICQVVYSKMGTLDLINASQYLNKLKFNYILFFLVILSLLLYLSRPLFDYVFDDGWELASQLIPLIAVWGFVYMAVSIYRLSYRIYYMQKKLLYIDFSYLVTLFLFSYNVECSVFHYILGSLALYSLSAFLTIMYIKVHIRKFYGEHL